MRTTIGVFALVGIVSLTGCAGRIDTAEKLASALQKRGVNHVATEEVSLPDLYGAGKVDEAIALTGENLRVEIYRAESERVFKLLFTSVVVGGAIERLAPGGGVDPSGERTQAYASKPFIVLVRQEPEAGTVKAALEEIFPPNRQG